MRRNGTIFVAGVLLLAVNLRPAVTAVPSILVETGRQLGYSSVVLTLVTTVPVLCSGSALSVPLYHRDGHSIDLPLGIWAAPALVAAVIWLPQLRQRTITEAGSGVRPAALRRSPLAWSVTLYMGLQSLAYYATLSILPDLYRSRGMTAATAGLVDTMLSVGGVITAVSAPVLVARFGLGRPLLVMATLAGLVGTVGPLFVPLVAALPLAFLLGLAQGVAIALALYFIMARAATPEVAGALSAMAQGTGYVIAAAGPLLAGLLHTASGGWAASVVLLAVLTATMLWFGLRAAVEVRLGPDGRAVPAEVGVGSGAGG